MDSNIDNIEDFMSSATRYLENKYNRDYWRGFSEKKPSPCLGCYKMKSSPFGYKICKYNCPFI